MYWMVTLTLFQDNHSYLGAMVSYGSLATITGEFTQRINTEKNYEWCEIDLFNAHVEVWRKKTLQTPPFTHSEDSSSPWTMDLPSSTSVLLYLRANQLRGLVLRPLFWPNSPCPASRTAVKSALELVWDTIYMLHITDERTDFYRKQHPFFHHFLASAVALLFLVVAHEIDNHSSLVSFTPDRVTTMYINQASIHAHGLAAAYNDTSKASREVAERLDRLNQLLLVRGFPLLPDVNSRELRRTPPSLFNHLTHETIARPFPDVDIFSRVHKSAQSEVEDGGLLLSPLDSAKHRLATKLPQYPQVTASEESDSIFGRHLGKFNETNPFSLDFFGEATDLHWQPHPSIDEELQFF